MNNFIKRMREEKRTLDSKIQRLSLFLSAQEKDGYPDIQPDELFLMGQQLACMVEYSRILGKRIDMHTIDA